MNTASWQGIAWTRDGQRYSTPRTTYYHQAEEMMLEFIETQLDFTWVVIPTRGKPRQKTLDYFGEAVYTSPWDRPDAES